MDNDLVLDQEYIVAHIKEYIYDNYLFHIFHPKDLEMIFNHINFAPNDYIDILGQLSTIENSVHLCALSLKANVSIETFQDVISILKSVRKCTSMKFLDSIIEYLCQLDIKMKDSSNYIQFLQCRIKELESQVECINTEKEEKNKLLIKMEDKIMELNSEIDSKDTLIQIYAMISLKIFHQKIIKK